MSDHWHQSRPDFSTDLTIRQFESHYWYKQEIVGICKQLHLSTAGTKAELELRIKAILAGKSAEDERRHLTNLRKIQESSELSLHTRLIPDGFKFNAQARQFFADYYNKSKFSFTKEMAAALREAERNGNTEMTVADLIRVYEGKVKVDSMEERTYQWNRFVKSSIGTNARRKWATV